MLAPRRQKKEPGSLKSIRAKADLTDELKIISDLGRSLLFTVHPKKVASRVTEAILEGVNAETCAFIVGVENIGLVKSAVNHSGAVQSKFLDKARFEKWLKLLPPQMGFAEEKSSEFFLTGKNHRIEYISPLHINGEVKGAIITAFGKKEELTERKARLIDAATQMAAMSVNLSAHYENALHDSITKTKEEHRKFTEAVLDALPVSLYVVDRDYRIVTWNRHREVGVQGIPRDSALGRDVFQVLAKYPEGRLRQEFERAFATGKIERIEQQTVADDIGLSARYLCGTPKLTRYRMS
jgi:hypothetical protein